MFVCCLLLVAWSLSLSVVAAVCLIVTFILPWRVGLGFAGGWVRLDVSLVLLSRTQALRQILPMLLYEPSSIGSGNPLGVLGLKRRHSNWVRDVHGLWTTQGLAATQDGINAQRRKLRTIPAPPKLTQSKVQSLKPEPQASVQFQTGLTFRDPSSVKSQCQPGRCGMHLAARPPGPPGSLRWAAARTGVVVVCGLGFKTCSKPMQSNGLK